MSSVNKAILVGNLGADPETRTTGSGMVVATLRVATNERVKDGDDWADHTEWHRVVCFGKVAENASRYLTKGRQIYVEGKIRTRKWTDKDGNDKYTTEILADNVTFLSGGRDGDRPGAGDDRGRSSGGGGERGRSSGGGGSRASSGGGDW